MSFTSGANPAIQHTARQALEKESGDRPCTEPAIRLPRHQQELILNSISEGIHGIDQDGRIVFENPAAARMLGWEISELIGRPAHCTMHYRRFDGSAYAQGECPIYACLRMGATRHVEDEVFWRKDGSSFPVEYTCSPTRDEKGKVVGAVVVFTDITERKLAEVALQKSEGRYRALFENMLEGYVYCRAQFKGEQLLDFTYLEVNSVFEKLTGLKNVVGKNISEVIPGFQESNRELCEIYTRVALTGRPEKCESYVEALGIWLSISVYSNEKEHFIVVFDNITERKLAENVLRESEARFSAAFEQAPIGIALMSPDGHWFKVNRALCDLVGYSQAELLARTYEDITHPQDLAISRENVGRLLAGEIASYQIEKCYLHARGNLISVLLNVSLVRDGQGQPLYFISQIQDITERKRAEEELSWKTAFFEAQANSSLDGILVVDEQGRQVLQNQRFIDLLKIPRHIAEGKNDEEQLRWVTKTIKKPEVFVAKVNHLYSHPNETSHDEVEMEDGTILERYSAPVIGQDGKNYGRIWTFRDITERKQAEVRMIELNRQLVDLSRRAGMAEIATSVLHNVGNVLNSANVSLEVATAKVRDLRAANLGRVADLLRAHAHDLPEFLTEHPQGRQLGGYLTQLAKHFSEEQAAVLSEFKALRTHVDHISEIVSRQQSYVTACGVIEVLPINALIDDVLSMNAPGLDAKGFQVFREFDESIPPLPLDRHKIMQILVNLIRNARHALADAGSSERRLTVRSELQDHTRLKITVADNGVGISPENLPRIFEHGFTTRKLGHGFGLHSSAVTAQEMGGSLQVASAGPGQGAVFTLEIPIGGKTA